MQIIWHETQFLPEDEKEFHEQQKVVLNIRAYQTECKDSVHIQ